MVHAAIINRRLSALRSELRRQALAGFVVPHEDEYLNEYIRPAEARLEWLTGFTGSVGIAVVLAEHAAVLSDARYTAQIGRQCPAELFEPHDLIDLSWCDYVARHANGGRIGFDASLHSVEAANLLRTKASMHGFVAVPVTVNPIDRIWSDRPVAAAGQAAPHPMELAGESAAAKCLRLGLGLGECSLAVIAACDSVAWLLNLRGNDVPRIPVPLCRALLRADGGVELFIDPASVDAELRDHLGFDVTLRPPAGLAKRLDALGGQPVLVDPALTPDWIEARLERAGARIVHGADPVLLAKAVKNPTEIAGFRAAHRRDGAAFTVLRFPATRRAFPAWSALGDKVTGSPL